MGSQESLQAQLLGLPSETREKFGLTRFVDALTKGLFPSRNEDQEISVIREEGAPLVALKSLHSPGAGRHQGTVGREAEEEQSRGNGCSSALRNALLAGCSSSSCCRAVGCRGAGVGHPDSLQGWPG